jgi:hypothetical protein
MDPYRVRFVHMNMKVATSNEEFRFQLKTRGSNMGQRSIILGLKTRGVEPQHPHLIDEVVLALGEAFLLLLLGNFREEKGCLRPSMMMPCLFHF